jgi:hypothetical protein
VFDLARYLADRVGSLYPAQDLSDVLSARGVPVIVDLSPDAATCTLRSDPAAVILRAGASERDQAHELFHSIIWENTSNGIEYEAPAWDQQPEETAADRFAALLAGEDA